MVIYCWKLQPPDKLILNMIKGGADVGGINDLIHWSEGDLSTCFLPFMRDVKTASPILATLTAIIAYCNSVIFFPNSMLEPILQPTRLKNAIIFMHFLSNAKRSNQEKVNRNILIF